MIAEPETVDTDPVAIVFPGQGSQRLGMARDFHDHSPIAKQVFEEASDAADLDLSKICFEEEEKLNLTEFAQPAILTAEVAMYRVLEAEFGLTGELFAGHSLGEYTALVAVGAIELTDAARLVRRRGSLMQGAVAPGAGAMLAVIGQGLEIDGLRAALEGLEVDAANHNSPTQIVISGKAADVQVAEEKLGGDGFRCVRLNVSAPFHSRFMKGIEETFAAELEGIEVDTMATARVASNHTGKFHSEDAAEVRAELVRQISGTVRWVENMQEILSRTRRIYEVGPNRPLSGFFRELDVMPEAIRNLASAKKVLAQADL